MAPKREQRLTKKGDKSSRYHHASSSNSNSKNIGPITPTNDSFPVEWSSTANPNDEPPHHRATPTHHAKTNEEATYVHYDRPWTQDNTNHNYNTTTYAMSPMQRWQTESMLDEPYHAMEGATIIEGQYTVLNYENIGMDDGWVWGLDKELEKDGSMAVEATSEKYAPRK